jgi:hypothetical protein
MPDNRLTPQLFTPTTHPLGRYLIAAGFATPEQISYAVRIQPRRRTRLGVLLIEQGLIAPEELADLLVVQSLDFLTSPAARPRFLGEYLLQHAIVTPEAMAHALTEQLARSAGRTTPLGELLVAQGAIGPAQIRRAIARLHTEDRKLVAFSNKITR